MQVLPLVIGAAGAVLAWKTRPQEVVLNRPYSEHPSDQCIGRPTTFNIKKNQPGFVHVPCTQPPIVKAVINCRGPGIHEEGNEAVRVPLCGEHFVAAEKQHREWFEDEPRDWQNLMFPMSSKNTRKYEHEYLK